MRFILDNFLPACASLSASHVQHLYLFTSSFQLTLGLLYKTLPPFCVILWLNKSEQFFLFLLLFFAVVVVAAIFPRYNIIYDSHVVRCDRVDCEVWSCETQWWLRLRQ